jgi:type IV pilus assembly protein PilY1
MHAPRKTLMVALLCASAASAQSGGTSGNGGMVALCHDTTGQDRQPDFSPSAGFDWTSVTLTNDNPPALRLNTNLEVLNTERIYFPFTQQVSVSYLYESAGHSAALGYFYYEDLIARGYIDTNNTPGNSGDDKLKDADSNGIADFHEDLYSMSTTRDYIGGTGRRCSRTFTFNGKSFYEPELAMQGCGPTYNSTVSLKDARPGQTSRNIQVATVGQALSGSRSGTQYSDQGLYPTIPNLLEPVDPANKKPGDTTNKGRGLGHLIFLHSDDDTDINGYSGMTPVSDSETRYEGIPDYNVSNYDPDGRKKPAPLDSNSREERDRTVNLGELEGGKEIVFYLVAWGAPSHAPGGTAPQVYPCLSFDTSTPGGACKLHLISPTTVFFSKTMLNMDQNALDPTPAKDAAGNTLSVVAKRDIGCTYGAGHCNDTGEALEGWLDQPTLERLQTEPAYRNLVMPHEKAYVKADTSGRKVLPHVLVGAPSTDKYRWILGFEDLAGGGDRDFNDVSFMIHKSNGGVVRSGVVSGDLSPSISQDYTITEVTFRAVDEPYYSSTNPALCKTRPAEDRPRITYQVALDCKVCTGNCGTTNPILTVNEYPTWTDVPLEEPPVSGAQRDSTVTIRDFLQRSLTGSQLCWRSIMRSKDDTCQPTIRNINVSYKAMKAGDYGRAAVSTVANTVLYGAYETPGRTWFQSGTTPPSTRVVDGRLDLSERGHLYLKELYKPEIPTATTGRVLWDGGRKLGEVARSEEPSGWRKLITMRPNNTRAELKDVLLDGDGGEAFSATNCGISNGGRWVCDLDGSGGTPGAEDRALLRNWLYGWERRTGTSTDEKRTWPMGGVQLSTPAIIGGGSTPSWWTRVTGTEQAKFTSNFMADARVSQRSTVAYVGTIQGYLHGVQAGALRMKDDPCTSELDSRGHFEGCNDSRNYGSARELFAYLPRKLLPNYVGSYLRQGNGKRAMVDASPSVADVDLGFGAYNPTGGNTSTQPAWTIGTNPGPTEGAKTVLVSPTGPSLSVVFSLDITDPSHPSYPQPMWEFDMANDAVSMTGVSDAPTGVTSMTVEDAFADMHADQVPDTRGSRHSAPIVRMDFGAQGGRKWVAVVGTDYVPNSGTAGSLYLLDMKTGQPVQVAGSSAAARLAGVVPLATGEGVGGEPAAVDANEDGAYDLLYAATTGGKLFRISTTQVDSNGKLGRKFKVCELADVKKKLTAEGRSDAGYQGIYSSVSVRLQQGATGKAVRLYLGTANNPDLSDEPADTATPRPHGYVLAYEDASPMATDCTDATHLWTQQLGEGQLVWGGVAIAGDNVYTTTAVGKAASACELSGTESGNFYAFGSGSGQPMPNSGTPLGGHGLSTPVVHDEHLIMLTADGKVMVKGDPGKWNNQTATTHSGPVRIRVWDTSANGRLQP